MSHQPSNSNEEIAQALMMKTAQHGGLHTKDIIKALQAKDAEREKAVEEERERIEAVFEKEVPPHPLSLEDGVWLKRLLNKAFGYDNV